MNQIFLFSTFGKSILQQVFMKHLLLIFVVAICTQVTSAAPGNYDSSFGNKGKVLTQFSNADGAITSLAVQPDGKFITAGYRFNGEALQATVSRYDSDGSLDVSFGVAGTIGTTFGQNQFNFSVPYSVVIQNDGKILVSGAFWDHSDSFKMKFGVVRFNSNGLEDVSFGSNGYSSIQLLATGANVAYASVLQSDGKIILAGQVKQGIAGTNDYLNGDFGLVRFNSNGSIDTGFGLNGQIIADFSGDDEIRAIAVQTDGKIIVGGKGGSGVDSNFIIAKYNSDGTLDTAFGNSGSAVVDFGDNADELRGMRVQSDGKIVAIGNSFDGSQKDFAIARLNANGSLDSSFGVSGKIITNVTGHDDEANAVELQSDGKIVVTGKSIADSFPNYDFSMVRYNDNGSLDTSFGTSGKVVTSVNNSEDGSSSVAMQPDGKIISAGESTQSFCKSFTLIRYNTNGSVDNTFGTNGKVIRGAGLISGEHVGAINTQPNGKILAAGNSSSGVDSDFALTRYDQNGSLDTSFGIGGKVKTPVSQRKSEVIFKWHAADDSIRDAVIQSDGKIIAAGYSFTGQNYDVALVRYNSDGSIDSSFGLQGKVLTDIGGGRDSAVTVVLQNDGKIVIAGFTEAPGLTTHPTILIIRYNQNGSLDASFGNGGIVVTSLGASTDVSITDMIIQPDGKIIFCANHLSYDPVADQSILGRYNSNGSVDTTFGSNGFVYFQISTSSIYKWEDVRGLAFTNGKILVVAEANFDQQDYNDTEYAMLRFDSNGVLDTTFGTNGLVRTNFGTYRASTPNDLDVQPDGKILITGFTENRGYGNFNISLARYSNSGVLDQSFGSGGKVWPTFPEPTTWFLGLDATIQSNGKILVGGFYISDGESGFDMLLTRYQNGFSYFDYDGDSKSDISYFHPDSQATWNVIKSSDGSQISTQWGGNGDKIVPADYDGDGQTDLAVFRPSNNVWYILNSSNNTIGGGTFGQSNIALVPADYDGDRKADLAYFVGGYWQVLRSSNGQVQTTQFGITTDKPVVGDFDGDHISDFTVYRDGIWYILGSTQGFYSIAFGLSTDRPVAADYDGDEKTDVAIFRPGSGQWWILKSTDLTHYVVSWGVSTDITVPADYDGDFKADIAVFRNGAWWILQSSNGSYLSVLFGQNTDTPTPSAFYHN